MHQIVQQVICLMFLFLLKNDGDKLLVKTLFIDEIKRQLTYYDETIATNNADRLYFLKQHTLVTELKYDEIENVYRIKGFKK
ncbi:GTP-binding protein HflX [Staphylococcus aureus]|nr:GTP-binding protein HflX [Staphylococcus aureus]